MGGKPITCLNLATFPSGKLDDEVLGQIMAGGLEKITEAGAVLAGGHTIEGDEPVYGLSVTGIVHPDKIWKNSGAREGDVLILTKAIGSGVLLNANIKKWVSLPAMEACIESMTTLNKNAAEILSQFDIHGATDITGFGLTGHAYEMARGAGLQFHIEIDKIPVMAESLEMYRKGMSTGVNAQNRLLVEQYHVVEKEMPDWHREILYDPQTNGGLLVALPESEADEAMQKLHDGGVFDAARIGRVFHLTTNTYLVFK
jgi:selenide,water dikinase